MAKINLPPFCDRFELELISENAALDLRAFLAFSPDGLRIHGLIYQVARGESGKPLPRYKLSIVPPLSYLGLRTKQRIFQHLTVPEIFAQVLQEHGIVEGGYQFLLGPTVTPSAITACSTTRATCTSSSACAR